MGQDDRQRAQELLSRADKILQSVDESYIIKERGQHPRPMPRFNHSEIELGRTLGVGGFGIVSEITAFELEHEDEKEEKAEEEEHNNNGDGGDKIIVEMPNELYEDDDHYDIEKARGLMKKRCLRKGVTRYAIKRLHDHMTELEKARGMIDLAVEAKYLSVVWHPNIGTCLATLMLGLEHVFFHYIFIILTLTNQSLSASQNERTCYW